MISIIYLFIELSSTTLRDHRIGSQYNRSRTNRAKRGVWHKFIYKHSHFIKPHRKEHLVAVLKNFSS